jgi:hypothetical protein
MAVVVAGVVILFDPIFQGMALSLMAGELTAVILTPVAVPVIYFLLNRHAEEKTMPEPASAPKPETIGG